MDAEERSASPRFFVAGQLTRDFVILPDGTSFLDVPGGSALYAAVGLGLWEPQPCPGILARVGSDYPAGWLERIAAHSLDIQGVRMQPEPMDVRFFAAFTERHRRTSEDPVAQFARFGLPFPPQLLGYRSSQGALDSRTRLQPFSLRQGDIPPDYLTDANAAHLCPVDYMTHSLLPAVLRQAEFATVTLDPSPGYMNSTYWNDVPALLTGLTAFLPSEEEMRALFQGRSSDLREMAEALAAYGCELIVIKRGESGQLLYDASTRAHWEVPSYPSRFINPIGAGDAFCGGFLAGYRRTYDPLQAVLHGNIAASFVAEGHDPFYALDTLPGLPEARLAALQQSARKI